MRLARARDTRGFTLLELIIALAIVGALLVIAFGGLRIALAAWNQGEDRAEAHQHLRSVAMVLARSVSAAYPYRGAVGEAPESVLLFRGTEERLELITQAPPAPAGVPVAFTALVLAIETEDGRPALVVRERVLPNRDPFTKATVALRDPDVQRLAFRYLDAEGEWQAEWDGEAQGSLPRAVEIAVSRARGARTETLPPLTVPLHVVQP